MHRKWSVVSAAVAAIYVAVATTVPCFAITPVKKTGTSGNHYQILFQNKDLASWTVIRPTSLDSSIDLCIPAAFTKMKGGVVGLYATDGKLQNESGCDHSIGGQVCIENGQCKIISAPAGKIDPTVAASLKQTHGQIFQAFQVVRGGLGEHFKDKTLYQRRSICQFKDGTVGVVESDEAITLTQFGIDLQELGATNAADMDMGSWDEGWYRPDNGGKIVVLGKDRADTNKQSNWLIFRNPIGGAKTTTSARQESASAKTHQTFEPFIPRGWQVEKRIMGDLNGDSVPDCVLQLKEKSKVKDPGSDETLQRMLIVLAGQADGSYRKIATATKLLYCTTCAGMMGDADGDNIEIKVIGGQLVVKQMMGDAEEVDTTQKFQWDAGLKSFTLLEEIVDSYNKTDPHGEVTTSNYKTGQSTKCTYTINDAGTHRVTRRTLGKIKRSVQRMENVKIED